jgi:CCR4-NOT transcription complex subunit 7/8
MYDIKYLMASIEHLNGGLQKVANELRVKRIGAQHQAGSDSLLTGQVFFKMYNEYFKEGLDDVKYNGFICGLGGACSTASSSTSTTTIITTNSITSTPSKSTPSQHHHQYLIEETCYEMEELRVNIAPSPARVH